MTSIKLKAGRDYVTRAGQTVRILTTDATSTSFPGCSAVGRIETSEIAFYYADGSCPALGLSKRDIVSEKQRGIPASLDIQLRRGGVYMARNGSVVRVVTDALSGEGPSADGLHVGLIGEATPKLFYADGKVQGLPDHDHEIVFDLSDASEDDLFVWFTKDDCGPFAAKTPPVDLIRSGAVDTRDIRVIQCFEDLPMFLPLDIADREDD